MTLAQFASALHHTAIYALAWIILYAAQMYFCNQLTAVPDYLPARIGSGILATLIVWRCLTISTT